MAYQSPVADILFSLYHVAGFADEVRSGLFGDVDLDTVSSVISEAGKFATDVIAPLNRTGDEEGAKLENGVVVTPKGFREAYKAWAEGGWSGSPPRRTLAAWACRIPSISPAARSGTAPRWPSRSARC